jgi:hypothetical protein
MRKRCFWVAAMMLGFTGATAFSASYGGGGGRGNAPNPAKTPAPPASQPAAPSQLSQDQAAEAVAAADLNTDKQALQTVQDAFWAKFEQTPDWIAAQSKLADAQSNLEAAKTAATNALTNNPDYQAALAAKQKAIDDLNAAKSNGDATPETLGPLATASLQASLKLKKLQSQVSDNDPGVQAAADKLVIAQHDVDVLKLKFQQGISTDKQYAASRAAVDAAQKNYDDAHAKVVSDGTG